MDATNMWQLPCRQKRLTAPKETLLVWKKNGAAWLWRERPWTLLILFPNWVRPPSRLTLLKECGLGIG